MQDIHFHQGYRHYPVTLSAEQLQDIDYQAGKIRHTLLLSNDLQADRGRRYVYRLPWVWQRRRYRQWHQSWSLLATWPRAFLILSKRIFEKGSNEVVVFETDGVEIKELVFCDQPVV